MGSVLSLKLFQQELPIPNGAEQFTASTSPLLWWTIAKKTTMGGPLPPVPLAPSSARSSPSCGTRDPHAAEETGRRLKSDFLLPSGPACRNRELRAHCVIRVTTKRGHDALCSYGQMVAKPCPPRFAPLLLKNTLFTPEWRGTASLGCLGAIG